MEHYELSMNMEGETLEFDIDKQNDKYFITRSDEDGVKEQASLNNYELKELLKTIVNHGLNLK